ncbi:hypothetical protein TH66_13470 [Carbonactinospora thermoautotrophica]|uniref:Uncharacterized protein n=1 Tax=Carbonactinospora thermoautotrophica TaxID=1469144 RepID=A0A132N0Y9_9ACTN|nr:hypothetical protein [Carbonactinospora thermoautotrophica]KWX02748.1 hypothetical protein LI90_3794 [Carbonactinospora thermoautotrophica]KWX03789.1 hypothetical protein TH66_13470 [Carbonactinospora thermoautotrophica]
MRHNGRPVLLASTLPPNRVSLYPGERPQVACPDCGRWRFLRRGMLVPHRADDGVSRCPGSAQRVVIDLTPAEWQARLREAARHAGQRRSMRVQRKPQPPVPPPVFRMRAA